MKPRKPDSHGTPRAPGKKRPLASKVRADGREIRTRKNAAGKLVLSTGQRDLRNNRTIVAKVQRALEAGSTRGAACRLAGFSHQTLCRWMRQGESAPEGTPARRFCDAVHLAEARAEARRLKTVNRAARKNWKAAAWLLKSHWQDNQHKLSFN